MKIVIETKQPEVHFEALINNLKAALQGHVCCAEGQSFTLVREESEFADPLDLLEEL